MSTIKTTSASASAIIANIMNQVFFLPGFQVAKFIFTCGLSEPETEKENTLHPLLFIQPLALPGEVIFGLGSFISVIVYDSVSSAINVFTTLYNAGLDADEQINNHDTRDLWKVFSPLAFPGIMTGFFAALCMIIIIDNLKGFFNAFVNFYNEGLIDNENTMMFLLEEISNKDNTSDYRKYFIHAWPSLIAGCLTGLFCAAIYDNIYSGIGTFIAFCNLVLPDEYQLSPDINTQQDKREEYRKYNLHSLPSILIGAALGTIAATIIAITRLFIITGSCLFSMCLDTAEEEQVDYDKNVFNGKKKSGWSTRFFGEAQDNSNDMLPYIPVMGVII